MTNRKRSLLKIVKNTVAANESCRHTNESAICDSLMYTLSRLDMGHDGVVRYHMANELYILLKYGALELQKHRSDINWWG
jgi:hypothetical protein